MKQVKIRRASRLVAFTSDRTAREHLMPGKFIVNIGIYESGKLDDNTVQAKLKISSAAAAASSISLLTHLQNS